MYSLRKPQTQRHPTPPLRGNTSKKTKINNSNNINDENNDNEDDVIEPKTNAHYKKQISKSNSTETNSDLLINDEVPLLAMKKANIHHRNTEKIEQDEAQINENKKLKGNVHHKKDQVESISADKIKKKISSQATHHSPGPSRTVFKNSSTNTLNSAKDSPPASPKEIKAESPKNAQQTVESTETKGNRQKESEANAMKRLNESGVGNRNSQKESDTKAIRRIAEGRTESRTEREIGIKNKSKESEIEIEIESSKAMSKIRRDNDISTSIDVESTKDRYIEETPKETTSKPKIRLKKSDINNSKIKIDKAKIADDIKFETDNKQIKTTSAAHSNRQQKGALKAVPASLESTKSARPHNAILKGILGSKTYFSANKNIKTKYNNKNYEIVENNEIVGIQSISWSKKNDIHNPIGIASRVKSVLSDEFKTKYIRYIDKDEINEKNKNNEDNEIYGLNTISPVFEDKRTYSNVIPEDQFRNRFPEFKKRIKKDLNFLNKIILYDRNKRSIVQDKIMEEQKALNKELKKEKNETFIYNLKAENCEMKNEILNAKFAPILDIPASKDECKKHKKQCIKDKPEEIYNKPEKSEINNTKINLNEIKFENKNESIKTTSAVHPSPQRKSSLNEMPADLESSSNNANSFQKSTRKRIGPRSKSKLFFDP